MAEDGKKGVPLRVRLESRQMTQLKTFRKRGENLSAAIRRGLDAAFAAAGVGEPAKR